MRPYTAGRVARLVKLGLVMMGLVGRLGYAQTVADVTPAKDRVDDVFARQVSVRLDHVALRTAVEAIAKNAGIRVQYEIAALRRVVTPVSLNASRLPLGVAMDRILAGTSLQAVALDHDLVGIQPIDDSTQSRGVINGIVTDASTKRPISGATVTMDDSLRMIRTNVEGRYHIANISPGTHRLVIRYLGYRVVSVPVTVADGQTVPVSTALRATNTTLAEVVTTATGDRRRLEVGNAVGTIHADSIVQTSMIRNVSDLLQSRLPGAVVSNTDGAVGAPSKIRLRGVSSLALNNDPIVILDGVRLNAQTTAAGLQTNVGSPQMLGQLGTTVTPPLAPSRLDDIDPNTIESIDVLRGPSASSLYGTDAANGVIVIKTKKGHPGSWRATVSGDDGWSAIPGKMPEMWWGWGLLNGTSAYTAFCNLAAGGQASVVGGGCQQDSVTQFNPQNNAAMQTMGTGANRSLYADLSGGTESLVQFLSGRVASNIGMAKMSDAERRLINRVWSSPAPSWMIRPNTQQDVDGSYRTTFNFSQRASASLTTTGSYSTVLNGGSGMTGPGYQYGASPDDTLNFLPSELQRTKVTSTAKRGTLSASTNYQPFAWLSLTGTGGGDYGQRVDASDLRAQDCSAILQFLSSGSSQCPSGHSMSRGETFVTTANAGGQLSFAPRSWLRLQTAFGEQYSHTDFYDLQAGNSDPNACPLAFGSSLLTPGPVCVDPSLQAYTVNESRDEAATAGVYLEETVSMFGLYYTLGVRHDVASAFGANVNKSPPNYPKFNFSYPLSEQSFFPKQSYISSLRLRAAYGQSGNQASQTAVLNNYALGQATVDDAAINSVLVSQLGNANLRPERGTEWEGGIDISFFDQERIHAEVTYSRKYTKDEITALTLPPSFGVDNLSQFYNLGNVDNRSLEVAVLARLLDTRAVNWSVSITGTKSANKLVTVASGINATGPLNTVFRAGYPVFGYWGAPVESYADVNHDGMLDRTEITFGTQQYMGAPYPKGEVTYSSDLSLASGALHFSMLFDHLIGQTTQLGVSFLSGSAFFPRAAVDRTAPLSQQAAYIQAVVNNNAMLGTSSTVRLRELSATYDLPTAFIRRLVGVQSLGLTLAGRNIATWSSYAGKDPNVDTSGLLSEASRDDGTGTPQPRIWTLRFNLGI